MITIRHRLDFDSYRRLVELLKLPSIPLLNVSALIASATSYNLILHNIKLGSVVIDSDDAGETASFSADEVDVGGSTTHVTHCFSPVEMIQKSLDPIKLLQLTAISTMLATVDLKTRALHEPRPEPSPALQMIARQLLGKRIHNVTWIYFNPNDSSVYLTSVDTDSNVDNWRFVPVTADEIPQ